APRSRVVPGAETVLERFRRVPLGHRDEPPLAPALRRQHLHPPLGERREPFTRELRLRQLLGQEDLRRGRDRFAVELADERREDLAVRPSGDLVEEERLLAHEPALAHEEELDAAAHPCRTQPPAAWSTASHEKDALRST